MFIYCSMAVHLWLGFAVATSGMVLRKNSIESILIFTPFFEQGYRKWTMKKDDLPMNHGRSDVPQQC